MAVWAPPNLQSKTSQTLPPGVGFRFWRSKNVHFSTFFEDMEISPNITSRPESDRGSAKLRLQHRLHDFKADMAERPFLYAGIPFVAGFIANTYPARILFLVVARLVSWFAAPAILLMGVMKLSSLLAGSRPEEPTLVQ